MPVLFVHGLEGSPQGTKAAALRDAGLEPVVPDGSGLPLAARLAGAEAALLAFSVPAVLVGSSYGGLVVALLAARHPDRVRGLLLCAPALEWKEPPNLDPSALVAPPGVPTHILHGIHDDVVPLAWSRRYRDRSGPHVLLEEVDDDHRLNGHIGRMVELARGMGEGARNRSIC